MARSGPMADEARDPSAPAPASGAPSVAPDGRGANGHRSLSTPPPRYPVRVVAPASLADIGVAVPWADRLSTRLMGIIAAASVVTAVAFAVVHQRVERQLLIGVYRGVVLLGETIKGSMHHEMLENRKVDAVRMMRHIGAQPQIARVRVFDGVGRVTFSTEEAETGKVVDRRAEACIACHAEDEPLTRPAVTARQRIYNDGDHRVVSAVTPIYNEPACSSAACHAHPAEQRVLGVLDVGISLRDIDLELNRFRRDAAVFAAAAILALVAIFYVFTRVHVVRPVAALVQATRRVAHDQLDLEIPVTWNGELGLLAASFNEMTRAVRKAESDLRALAENLEAQVEERTAALRATQDQLVRTEKLSSLGKLSASIAHEINNPLAGILTFAKLVIRSLEAGPPDDPTRKTMVRNLTLVQRETERCSAIVRSLLDFARERPLTLKDVSVNTVVEEGLSLLANQISIQGHELRKSFGELPAVEADFGQLRQAFVNIAMNACEAMGKGGVLTVATRALEGGQVEVEIGDTGPGIPPEALSKIFDPFWTTKEKGTGLGLSVSYGIVQRHGGKIEVRSEVGKGTRFFLRLPVAIPHAK